MAHNVLDTLPFPVSQTASAGQTLADPGGSNARISPISTGVMNNTVTAPTANPFYDNDGCATAKFRPDLAGQIVSVRDYRNGTYQPKLLRAVQLNLTGSTSTGLLATPGNVALVVQPDPTAAGNQTYSRGTALQLGNESVPALHGRLGVVAMQGGVTTGIPAGMTAAGTNSAPTAGAPAKPLYDGYGPGRVLLCGDWVWVVEEGPCTVPLNSGQTATTNYEAAAHSDGSFRNAADGETVAGTFAAVNNTNATVGSLLPYTALLMVKRGYHDDRTGAT